jgi:AraC-like DNA-binding protein
VLCVFSTALTTRKNCGRPLQYFTAFLVLQAASFLGELLIAHPATPYKALWLGLLMSVSLLLAPCLWLAVQESIAEARPREIPRGHRVAMAIGALCTTPLMLAAHSGTGWSNPLEPASWLHARFIHTTMLICMGVFIVQVPCFLARSRKLLLEKLDGRSRHWVEFPLAIVFTTWSLAIVRTLDCAFIKWPPMFSLVVALVSVSATVAALYMLLREFRPQQKGSEDRYARSPLDAAVRRRIRRKLEAALAQPEVYKRSDLSLAALARLVNESPHYVSQVISQELTSSFHELVNDSRIEYAKRLLLDSRRASVLAIAMEAGFNSKSAFHAAFRRVTGTTPSDYRESNS